MTETPIPQWAFERAAELVNTDDPYWKAEYLRTGSIGKAFAAYIAQHEKPPIDPLLLEARLILADLYEHDGLPLDAKKLRAGSDRFDGFKIMRATLAALRRGIEIAKEQSNA